MKPKSFLRLQGSPFGNFFVLCLGIVGAGVFLGVESAHAANQTWDGGASGTGTDFSTAANWTNDTLPTTVGDTAIFDGVAVGNLALSYTNTGFAGGSGQAGMGLSLTANQSGNVSIDSTGGGLRLSGIVNNSSTAALTLGDGTGANFNVVMGNGSPHAFTNNSSGSATIGSEVVFSALGGGGSHTFAFDGSGNWALNGSVSVTGVSITKSGAGTLTVGSVTNNTGAVTINAGTVAISGAGKLGTATSTLALAGGVLDLGATSNTVGAATVSVPAASGDTIKNGTLAVSSMAITNTTGTVTLSANVTSSGTLSKTNAGSVILNGNTNVTGDVSMVNGSVSFYGTNVIGGNLSHGGGNVYGIVGGGSTTVTGNLQYTFAGSNFRVTGGALTVAGATSSSNSAFRALELNGGTFQSNGDVFSASAGIATSFSGGTLKSGNAAGITIYDADNTIDINAAGGVFDTTTGSITMGANTNSANVSKLNGTTGGSITVKGGHTLKAPITNTGLLVLQDSSIWDANGVASSLGGLSGTTGTLANSGAAQTVTLNVTTGTQTFAGAITTGYLLLKNGAGAQTLSGNNTLSSSVSGTSALRLEGGTLTLSGNNALSATGAATGGGNVINVVGAATLELTGTNIISGLNTGAITVGTGGTLSVNSIANALNGATRVNLGGGSSSGRLLYTGTGETTAMSLGSTAGSNSSGILDQSGTGNLKFTSNTAFPASILSLTLQGSTAGTGEFAGVIANGSTTGMQLIKTGTGKWTLSGANTYGGDTSVLGGILAVSGNSIPDAGKLVVDGGKVQATGTEVVATLYFGATQQVAGTWGATGSGATHIDDAHFSGTTGVVSVASGPAGGFSTWASANAGGQTASQDYDNDGVSNGIEYFMGQTGSSFTANPAIIGGSVSWPKDPAFSGSYKVQTSSNLVNWIDVTATDNGTSVSYTLPTGQGKLFVRLVVTPN